MYLFKAKEPIVEDTAHFGCRKQRKQTMNFHSAG